MQSGLPTNRTWGISTCSTTITTNCLPGAGGNTTTINVDPRGSFLLPSLFTLDIRVGKLFTMGKQRFEFDMDVYNLTNANTVYSTRTNTGVSRVTNYNDPNLGTVVIPSWNSATGALGPRIIRLGVTFWFSK
jgi:hypothetical protein